MLCHATDCCVAHGCEVAKERLCTVINTTSTASQCSTDCVHFVVPAGAEELEKRLLLMQKEQKLIQEEAQQAVLQAAASQPAAMAGASVGQPAADSSMAAPAQVG